MKLTVYSALLLTLSIAIIYIFAENNPYTFTAEVDGAPVNGLRSFANYSKGRLIIYTMLKGNAKKGIVIFVNVSRPGAYLLNSQEGPDYEKGNYAQYHFGDKDDISIFVTDGLHSGKCKITEIDFDNKSVSGTFEFEAFQLLSSGLTPRAVRITKGAFENVRIKEIAEEE